MFRSENSKGAGLDAEVTELSGLECCMLKRWFALSLKNGPSTNGNGASSNGLCAHGLEVMEAREETDHHAARAPSPDAVPKALTFEQIYMSGAVKPPQLRYGILKVAEMAGSTHLAGMTPEAKRCALLMALEAAGAEIEDLLQDALVRQRALHDYEEKQQERLSNFEAAKLDENRAIQAELDRITSQYMARIQANMDEVACQQDNFHDWQKRKQQECNRMTETAAFLVPQGNHNGTFAAVLERTSASRR